jgi:hypothetical protein
MFRLHLQRERVSSFSRSLILKLGPVNLLKEAGCDPVPSAIVVVLDGVNEGAT